MIIGDPHRGKSDALFEAMGEFVDSLGGRYITAADSGTGVAEMQLMAQRSRHVAGASVRAGFDGDPSPSTAYGVFVGLQAAVRHRLDRDDLRGLKVAIQGVGQVGFGLARHLREAGAELFVTDIVAANVQRAVDELGAHAVRQQDIYGLDVDVVFKVNEGRPNVADEIVNRKVDLVINTPLGRESFFDDRAVRRAAMMHDVPCITTLTGAAATVSAIRADPP